MDSMIATVDPPQPQEQGGRSEEEDAGIGAGKTGNDTDASMGQSLMKLFFDNSCQKEVKVVMLGLDAAGKTTILYRLHVGEVLSTVPTIGFNVEKVEHKNVAFTVWDVGGQDKLRPLWRQYLSNSDALIYVVDSMDRDRIRVAREEFQAVKDPLMLNSVILVLANKQDMKGAMKPPEVGQRLGVYDLKNRTSRVVGACALTGEGLHEGLGWLAATLKDAHEWGSAVRF
ncbi:ADP-ribosylation factor-like [Panicum miliaceum]|uniref:ADP-ribosylation factor-like n=1 Tax=Panicum miliaceum TaxID=4540 RepID=A0A3L6S201_PANMI|nr:ADP-ribosylation factor-like [Panicum miliaceum]